MSSKQQCATAKERLDSITAAVKPYVDAIEQSVPTTRGHYGDYLDIISRSETYPVQWLIARALKEAGANAQGVNDALNIASGRCVT